MNSRNLLAAILLLTASAATAQTEKKITGKFPLPGDGKWDYLTVSDNRLFVSHGTEAHVLDKASGKELYRIGGLSGMHGIAIDGDNGKGYISNGGMNNVVVFDLGDYRVLSKITTGVNPDFIMLEPFSHTVITGNGKSNSLSVIDPKSDQVRVTVEVSGKPEAIVSDGNGKAYVNLEDRNVIAVIDTRSFKVEREIQLPLECEEPAGLALDREHDLLFAGCGNGKLAIVQAASGKIVQVVNIGQGCDGVVYDPSSKTVYASNVDGTLSRVWEAGQKAFIVQDPVKTSVGAKTLALDSTNGTVYLPVADFTGKKDDAGKPTFYPGTFKVLVVK